MNSASSCPGKALWCSSLSIVPLSASKLLLASLQSLLYNCLSVCARFKCSCWTWTHLDFSLSGRLADRRSLEVFCWQVKHRSDIGFATTTFE